MRALFLVVVCAVISTGSVYAKGEPPIEVTPESIEQKGIPWEIWVHEDTREKNGPDSMWFVSLYIKFRHGEQYKDAMPGVTQRTVGRLEMRDKDGNSLMSAYLNPKSVNDEAIEFQFRVHKGQLASFSFWYIPRISTAADEPVTVSSAPPVYFLVLGKLIDDNTRPDYHREWPRNKAIAPAKRSEPRR